MARSSPGHMCATSYRASDGRHCELLTATVERVRRHTAFEFNSPFRFKARWRWLIPFVDRRVGGR